jgi:hypothetical protein
VRKRSSALSGVVGTRSSCSSVIAPVTRLALGRVAAPAALFSIALRRLATCSATSASLKPNSIARRYSACAAASARFHSPSPA